MKSFRITYEIDETLTVDQIWPDGDAPKCPGRDDVIALLKRDTHRKLAEWNLDRNAELHVEEEVER